MTIAVLTDSSSQLPDSWVEAFDLTVLDLHSMVEDGTVAATAALTPDELGQAYQDLLEREEVTGVVSVHLASKLSRTWESAVEAAARFGGRVHVVDSESVGMGIGGAAAQAAMLGRLGAPIAEVSSLAGRIARASTTWLAVNKMDSLRRGGRVGAAFALFGGALAAKPVLKLRGGNLTLAAKARTVTKTLAKLHEFAREELGKPAIIAVQYTGDREAADQLALEFRKETTFPERVLVAEIDPVLAWHVGEDAVAVTVCPIELDELPIPAA